MYVVAEIKIFQFFFVARPMEEGCTADRRLQSFKKTGCIT